MEYQHCYYKKCGSTWLYTIHITCSKHNDYFQDAKIPLTQLHVDELINALDQDGDGEIDFR